MDHLHQKSCLECSSNFQVPCHPHTPESLGRFSIISFSPGVSDTQPRVETTAVGHSFFTCILEALEKHFLIYPSWAPNPGLLIYSIRGVRMGSHQYEISYCDSNQFSSWYNLQLVITKCVSFHEKCSGQRWPFALPNGSASYTWNPSWCSPTTSHTLPSGSSNRFYLDHWGNASLSVRKRTIPRCNLTSCLGTH